MLVAALAGLLAAGAAGAGTPPTRYLEPLRSHQSELVELRREIDRLGRLPPPATADAARDRAAEIRRAGNAYLVGARAFSRTLDGFVAGGTRRGLDTEVEVIRSTVRQVLAAVDAYRALSGASVERPTSRTVSVLEQELRSTLGAQIARRIPNKLVAEGVSQMVAGASFGTVLRETLEQVRRSAYAAVDQRVRAVVGLGLRDLRDMKRAIRLRASQEVDRLVGRLLVRVTGNALVIELVSRYALPWLTARLTELMRPRLTLDERVARSIRSLDRAAADLASLPADARLRTVHARWQAANASLAATRFLVSDVKRAGREGLLAGDYGEALTGVERAMRLAEARFLLHKEDLVQTLAVDREELRAMLRDLTTLVGRVVVPATRAGTLEDELTAGSWTFGRVGGAVLCTVTFTRGKGPSGTYVLRACHPNESFWRLEGRSLVILHADGTPTSRLTRRDAGYWQGPYLGHPSLPADGTVHYIRR